MVKIIITRHGETEENKQGILQGHLPGVLSNLGIEQAKQLAKRLKNERIDLIFSSDLARASDTAKEIAKLHPEIKLFLVPELRERDQGTITGKSIKEIDWNKPRDTEKSEAMLKRASSFISNLIKKYPDKTVLLVGHNGINKEIIAALLNKGVEELRQIEAQKNTAITIFEINKDKIEIKLMNCTEHLK